ncbi:YfmQ family protein [Metabacillus idriensis]|uniref:YfmQ family protein n=1 Tax=Metabacillus idriensis TaxID=324768 RepID=UPI003D283D40
MTLAVLISLILMSAIKIVMTCLPTFSVDWLISKFEVHSKLSASNSTVTINGKSLKDEGKIQVINDFNEAVFIKKYYIYRGNENLFLHPENGGTPIVIDAKKGKKDVRIFVYSYKDHVYVVKRFKKKIAAYSLLSDRLQNRPNRGSEGIV